MSNACRPICEWLARVALAGCLTGCAHLDPQSFAGHGPTFDPVAFFTGRTGSWGVFEDRTGANPTRWFTTDCVGRQDGGELVLGQTFRYNDGTVQKRLWHIRRVDEHRYEATANDVVGVGRGEAYGNAFHWEYTVALQPGNPLLNVRLEQWMYLQPDGKTMLNRGTVSTLGVTVAQIAEEFVKADEGKRQVGSGTRERTHAR